MILSDNFYTAANIEVSGQSARAIITFNAVHPIFSGHFPQVPVVPGVCMMQIVKEFVERLAGVNTDVKKVAQMKFLTLINPREVSAVNIQVDYIHSENGELQVTANLLNDQSVYFKFKGTLAIVVEETVID